MLLTGNAASNLNLKSLCSSSSLRVESCLTTACASRTLLLSNNRLNGTLPSPLGTALVQLDVSGNQLSGPLPSALPASSMRFLSVHGNTLNGSLPASYSTLTGLRCVRRLWWPKET